MLPAKEWYDLYSHCTFKSYFFILDRDLDYINPKDEYKINKLFEESPKVVKLNNLTPKDVIKVPIFNDFYSAINTIKKSLRCTYEIKDINTLMIREVDTDILKNPHKEFRCFIYGNNLRAISSQYREPDEDILKDPSLYKNTIIKFINDLKYLKSNMVIDIFCYPEINKIILIECNQWERSGGELFNWNEDLYILTENNEVTFRYIDMFYQIKEI